MKTPFARSFLMAVFLTLASCASIGQPTSVDCHSVSHLLSNAPQFDQTDVMLCGVLKYEFEDKNLYESFEAAGQLSDEECVSLGKAHEFSGDLKQYSGRRVIVFGTVDLSFCPQGTLCTSSCSSTGIFVKRIMAE